MVTSVKSTEKGALALPSAVIATGVLFRKRARALECLRGPKELARHLHFHLVPFPSVEGITLGGRIMREATVTLPELALIGGTRAALGAGLGLLLADRFSDGQRRAIGWTLFLVGALTTIPLAFEVLGKARSSDRWAWPDPGESRPQPTATDGPGSRAVSEPAAPRR
jgi:hypothetical protein